MTRGSWRSTKLRAEIWQSHLRGSINGYQMTTLKEPSALISSAAKSVPQRDTTADMP
jgi:hypothetical protein